jgi:hypothetical protein
MQYNTLGYVPSDIEALDQQRQPRTSIEIRETVRITFDTFRTSYGTVSDNTVGYVPSLSQICA